MQIKLEKYLAITTIATPTTTTTTTTPTHSFKKI